jgi:tetratricopeptide (TPR) repeat protein
LRYWIQVQLGEMYMKLGAAISAFNAFEQVNMWEEAIECLLISGQHQRAKKLAQEKLQEKETPRLLCTLGDITKDPQWYTRAWEVSNHRYSRAKRSLAREAFNAEDYQACAAHYAEALAINPLYDSAWFTQGCAYMRIKDWEAAAYSFRQVVSIEPEQAESWNNLAACLINLDKIEEAFVAIQQSVKYNRNSSKLWDNYLSLATQLRKFPSVLEAVGHLISLRQTEQLTSSLWKRLNYIALHEPRYRLRVHGLYEKFSLQTTLSHEVWKAFADLIAIDEDWMQVVELRLKACRALMKASWETNSAVCEELVEYLKELQATYALEDSEAMSKAKVEGRLFISNTLSKISARLGRQVDL